MFGSQSIFVFIVAIAYIMDIMRWDKISYVVMYNSLFFVDINIFYRTIKVIRFTLRIEFQIISRRYFTSKYTA